MAVSGEVFLRIELDSQVFAATENRRAQIPLVLTNASREGDSVDSAQLGDLRTKIVTSPPRPHIDRFVSLTVSRLGGLEEIAHVGATRESF